jgi:hypothetical protein
MQFTGLVKDALIYLFSVRDESIYLRGMILSGTEPVLIS